MQLVGPCACWWLPLQSEVQVPYCFHLTLEHFHSDSLESFLLTLEHSRVISALGPLTSSLGCLAEI